MRESAGINRHGVGDENALHRRRSESRWPRVMRWRPVRAQRSVDRGVRAGLLSRETPTSSGCRRFSMCGRPRCRRRYRRESPVDPARSENPGTHDELHAREPGELVVARWWLMMPRPGWFAGWQIEHRLGREGNASGGNPLMDDHEQSDRRVVPTNSPNNPACRGRRWWREGARPRGTRPAKRAPDAVPDRACPVIWIVCARWRGRTRMCGSPRSCIT